MKPQDLLTFTSREGWTLNPVFQFSGNLKEAASFLLKAIEYWENEHCVPPLCIPASDGKITVMVPPVNCEDCDKAVKVLDALFGDHKKFINLPGINQGMLNKRAFHISIEDLSIFANN